MKNDTDGTVQPGSQPETPLVRENADFEPAARREDGSVPEAIGREHELSKGSNEADGRKPRLQAQRGFELASEAMPLAIVGLGCLFPKAEGPQAYWSNIKDRVDGITEVPPSHWKTEDYFDQDPKSPDRTYGRRGGFLSPVDFDPTEFGISPNNIAATDPAQLLGLVVAQAAMRDAGYGPDRKFDRTKVSVVLGVTGTLELAIPLGARLGHPIWRKALREAGIAGEQAEAVIRRISDHYVEWQENSFPGLLGNVVAGRIANRLDLGGTNCVVDAACASSLSATHLAGLELATGRADMVVTGGVDTFNDIFMYMCFSKTPALSPTGDCRPFDAKGDGTILGEGIGMIVLKRLSDAEKDGDRIYAVLKGIGSSSDGRGKAIYAPSPEGQVQALKNAYRLAGVRPDTIQLVEGHGTGTKAGDAAELKALTEVYQESGRTGTWCGLGSAKSNVGHTKAAAGAAGLIKTALALKHKVFPPTLKVTEPLAGLSSGETPFYVNTEKRPWLPSAAHPRRAAVSAFGFGGSNFHAVLEEYRPQKTEIDWDHSVELAAISAPDQTALLAALEGWKTEATWDGVRVKAAASRRAFERKQALRLVVVLEKGKLDAAKLFASLQEAVRKNQGKITWNTLDGAYFSSGGPKGRLAALFPGQGAQYVGMGRDLICQFPVMLDTLAESEGVIGAALSDLMYPRPGFTPEAASAAETALRATDAAQPAIGAMSLGVLRLLRQFGTQPEMAGGHSYGELTALCAAGRFTPEELHRLSRLRGRLMAAGGGDKGTMLAALAPIEQVRRAVEEEKLDVVLANKNAPEQVVLSGSTEAVRRAAEVLQARGIRNTALPVAAAFHSRLVADAALPLREALGPVALPAGSMPVYANTTAEPYPADAKAAKDLLAGQLAAPVEFLTQIENMYRDGARVFLEIGPGARLTGLVKAILGDREYQAVAVDASAGKKNGVLDLAKALAQLSSLGLTVDLTPWEGGEEGVRELVERKKPKVVVRVSGATPMNPKGATQAAPLPAPRPVASLQQATPVVEHRPVFAQPQRAPAPIAAAAVSPVAATEALRLSQEGIVALQRLQEQSSTLHRHYLEGQETAQKALLGLIEQQNRVLLGGTALIHAAAPLQSPVAPLPAPAPAPVAIQRPVPVAAPVAAVAAPASPPLDTGRIESVLLAVVSDKTGYPVETLNLDMGLESDLGIDSIKRVEILAAMREKLPDAPVVGPQHIGTLRTLRQIIDFLAAGSPLSHEVVPLSHEVGEGRGEGYGKTPAHTAGGLDAQTVQAALLEVVSEKTGYPIETLNLDMGLESDLGIDSIKRVEILAAMREKVPAAPAVGPQHIGTLRTLRQIIDFLCATTGKEAALGGFPDRRDMAGGQHPVAPANTVVSRSVVTAVPFTGSRKAAPLPPGSKVLLLADGSPLGKALAAALQKRGFQVAPAPQGDAAALIVLAPESKLDAKGLWTVASERWLKDTFQLVRSAAPGLRKASGALLTVSRLDGAFGLGSLETSVDPLSGALAGLAKTAKHEWPEVRCRALDVHAGEPAALAARIAEELDFTGPLELGLAADGLLTLEALPTRIESTSPSFALTDVVLITGGARGVTAEAAVALAEASHAPIVLLGRTPLPEPEPEWLKPLVQEGEIKKALLQAANGTRPTPKELEAAYRLRMANREILATLARIQAAGSKVLYLTADVRDAGSVRAAVERASRELGSIRVLIHGAGVLADRFIEEKTSELFDLVFDTKVAGLRNLLACLDVSELKAVALFSSVSGRFGRAGQADYAMANEALNKAAQSLARRSPSCRVVSINWGPWEGGMVTPSLRKVFEQEGVGLLGLAAGGRHLVAELGIDGIESVVTGDAPVETASTPRGSEASVLAPAFERLLDAQSHPFLASHVINGHRVLPVAMMVEWLAHGALHGNPGLAFCGIDDLKVFKGVILNGSPASLRVLAAKAERDGAAWRVAVELQSESFTHARGVVVLASRVGAAESPARPVPPLATYARGIEEAYKDVLFHGPMLHGIEAVEGCSSEGIALRLAAAPTPSAWMRQPVRGSWIAEPLAIDSAFQAMILWSVERTGSGCLPSAFKRYRQYRADFPKQGLRAIVTVTRHSGQTAAADIDFVDLKGELVARIEGSEYTIDASLKEAFRKSVATH